MIHSVITSSFYANDLLDHFSSGVVHSVYRKTINLLMGDRLVALQACRSPLSPISLITSLNEPQMESLGISAGQRASFSSADRILTIISDSLEIKFSFEKTSFFDLKLPALGDASCIQHTIQSVSSALSLSEVGGFRTLFAPICERDKNGTSKSSSLADDFILLAAQSKMDAARTAYLRSNWTTSAQTLTGLIGLGGGLTPSGDDFLCGVLAGLYLTGQHTSPFAAALLEEIKAHLTDTNDISAAFLFCALTGQLSLPVCELAGLPSPDHICDEFSRIGHSSGMDTLCGIEYMLTLYTSHINA